MSTSNRHKILNDPVYGFVTLRHSRALELMDHPYVQRLRRISQLGLSHLVYPGAVHNRFHHAVGCLFLMQQAINTLREKGVEITCEEDEAVCFAILLHDIGHGPFSHALEHSIVTGVHHEDISMLIMKRLNEEFDGLLTLAIKIFEDNYHKKFLHQLVSSQLDMDRLDYLARDSFYSGVTEGKVGSERIIKMLAVDGDQLVIEEKGIYSIEKFIVARRLMYWQVYLHRTVLSAEHMLMLTLKRAKEISRTGEVLFASPSLCTFLQNDFNKDSFANNAGVLDKFCDLDDSDIYNAMKAWRLHPDSVLSELSSRLLDRRLFRIELRTDPFSNEDKEERVKTLMSDWGVDREVANFYVTSGQVKNQPYKENGILIKTKDGELIDFAKANDNLTIESLTRNVVKSFLCYPKDMPARS
ncbi:MAG: phosphohydrolase [Crocinitomicaceae bacterium]|nr:phosphohydrolase [Crocinitomicaceae bacterium]